MSAIAALLSPRAVWCERAREAREGGGGGIEKKECEHMCNQGDGEKESAAAGSRLGASPIR